MGTSALVMLLLVINAIVHALRATGQLTGEPDKDRRKVLGLLGSLPLGALVGTEEPAGLTTFARPFLRPIRQPLSLRDAMDASADLTEVVSRIISFSFDGLFARDVA